MTTAGTRDQNETASNHPVFARQKSAKVSSVRSLGCAAAAYCGAGASTPTKSSGNAASIFTNGGRSVLMRNSPRVK
jgi:hypothetical protein